MTIGGEGSATCLGCADSQLVHNAVAPSAVAAGEAFSLRLRVEDQYWNPARDGRGAFKVSLNGRPVGEINVPAGKYTGRLDGVKIAREGGYKFEVTSADGRFKCLSNPVLVERNPQQRIYWGELHGHAADEEGYGTVPLNDRLERLPLLVEVSRATIKVIWQNVWVFAFAVNIASVAAAAAGVTSCRSLQAFAESDRNPFVPGNHRTSPGWQKEDDCRRVEVRTAADALH
ncbi:MAG: hypothetical protein ACREAB_16390 [Blastocatellia bacterium]